MRDAPPAAIDLFCGAGGISLGLERAGFDIRLAIDHDEHVVRTFSRNFDAPVLEADLTTFDPATLDVEPGEIDLVAGGPPCPTFSSVGRSKIRSIEARSPEQDTRHELYEHFLRFVRELEPRVLLMENVPGMRSAVNDKGHSVIEVIRSEMRDLGYEVSTQFPDAADFGVPQHRMRTIFIGTRDGRSLPDLSRWESHREPRNKSERMVEIPGGESSSDARQRTLEPFGIEARSVESTGRSFPSYRQDPAWKEPWVNVGSAILDLPPLSPDGETPPSGTSDYILAPFTRYQQWARAGVADDELANHESRGHNMGDLSLYKLLGEGVGWIIGDIDNRFQPYRNDVFPDNYRKQRASRPATTVLAHISKDGHQYIHPREARSFSVREAARVQSFPDDFIFPVARTRAYTQVGNAVPPLLAQAIGTAILVSVLKD